jgi:hypothetical protein
MGLVPQKDEATGFLDAHVIIARIVGFKDKDAHKLTAIATGRIARYDAVVEPLLVGIDRLVLIGLDVGADDLAGDLAVGVRLGSGSSPLDPSVPNKMGVPDSS